MKSMILQQTHPRLYACNTIAAYSIELASIFFSIALALSIHYINPHLGPILQPLFWGTLWIALLYGPLLASMTAFATLGLNFALTQAPPLPILPFIGIQMLACAVYAGLLRRYTHLHNWLILLITYIGVSATLLIALLIAHNGVTGFSIFLQTFRVSWIGGLTQICTIPLLVAITRTLHNTKT